MNIIFISSLSQKNRNTWSSTLWHILEKLKENNNVIVIGMNMLYQSAVFTLNNFKRKRFNTDYSPIFSKIYSEKINRISDFDLIILGDLQLIPYLDVNLPIAHLSDITFRLFEKELKSNSSPRNIIGEKLERKSLDKYTKIIFCSNWAANDAINYYNISSDKIHVIEFGANIPHPDKYQIDIDTTVCNLVFIGTNWEKKGGDKVLKVYKKLKEEGFSCTLTIIGSVPPKKEESDSNLTIIPFLDKSKPEELKQLCEILYNSHFLVLPTEFDAFGIVFCEASAYGVPSIAANVGGVSQPICEGKNGFLLPAEATGTDYANKIKEVFNDKKNYIKLRETSRKEYETRLNWDVWAKKTNKILEETVANYKK